jgi:hypothetical protein
MMLFLSKNVVGWGCVYGLLFASHVRIMRVQSSSVNRKMIIVAEIRKPAQGGLYSFGNGEDQAMSLN